ncbi:MAG: hypothetical protein AAF585_26290, partial [Verrucomicrobiota bacterium]
IFGGDGKCDLDRARALVCDSLEVPTPEFDLSDNVFNPLRSACQNLDADGFPRLAARKIKDRFQARAKELGMGSKLEVAEPFSVTY